MALRTSSGSIPKDAIALSRAEALEYQWEQIHNWPDKMDVWPYRYGLAAQGLMSSASSVFVNRKFRKVLKLRHQGLGASLAPMMFIPPILSVVLHCQDVSADILLSRQECSLCIQHRAVAIQLACGMVYPLTLSPIANFMFANQYGTYRVPYWQDFSGHFELWLKTVKSMGKALLFFTCAHTLLAGFVTYGEFESLYTMRKKLAVIQQAIDDEKAKKKK